MNMAESKLWFLVKGLEFWKAISKFESRNGKLMSCGLVTIGDDYVVMGADRMTTYSHLTNGIEFVDKRSENDKIIIINDNILVMALGLYSIKEDYNDKSETERSVYDLIRECKGTTGEEVIKEAALKLSPYCKKSNSYVELIVAEMKDGKPIVYKSTVSSLTNDVKIVGDKVIIEGEAWLIVLSGYIQALGLDEDIELMKDMLTVAGILDKHRLQGTNTIGMTHNIFTLTKEGVTKVM